MSTKDVKTVKIRNPATKRWVGLSTTKGKEIAKAFFEKKITLSPEDVIKVNTFYGKTVVPADPIPMGWIVPQTKPNKIDIDERIQRLLLKFIRSARRSKTPYGSKTLRDFCTENKSFLLNNVRTQLTIMLNYDIWKFHTKYLNKKEAWPHENSFHNKSFIGKMFDIEFDLVNYPFYQNFLRTNPKPTLTLEDVIDTVWMKDMNSFLSKLTKRERTIVFGYTNNSMSHVNIYLYDKSFSMKRFYDWYVLGWHRINPFYYQILDLIRTRPRSEILVTPIPDPSTVNKMLDDIQSPKSTEKKNYEDINRLLQLRAFSDTCLREAFDQFIRELQTIILASPPLRKDQILFRGSDNDYFLKGSSKGSFHNSSFISATISPSHAALYTRGKKCCLHRLYLPKGSHVIFVGGNTVYPAELEFVLPHGCVYTNLQTRHISLPSPQFIASKSLCPVNPKDVEVRQLTDTFVLPP